MTPPSARRRTLIALAALSMALAGGEAWRLSEHSETPAPSPPVTQQAPAQEKPDATSSGAGSGNMGSVPSGQPRRGSVNQPLALPRGLTPALIRWAESMSDEMERAQGSAEQAATLFGRLESCADGRDPEFGAEAARAICLMHAQRLAELQPATLGERYKRLAERTPEGIQRIARDFSSN